MCHRKTISDGPNRQVRTRNANDAAMLDEQRYAFDGVIILDEKKQQKIPDMSEIRDIELRTKKFSLLKDYINTYMANANDPLGVPEEVLIGSVFHDQAGIAMTIKLDRQGRRMAWDMNHVFRSDINDLLHEYAPASDKEVFFRGRGISGEYKYYFLFLISPEMKGYCRYPDRSGKMRILPATEEMKQSAVKVLGVGSKEAKGMLDMWPVSEDEVVDDPLLISTEDVIELTSVLQKGLKELPASGFSEKELFQGIFKNNAKLRLNFDAPKKILARIVRDLNNYDNYHNMTVDDFDAYLRSRYLGAEANDTYACLRQFAKDIVCDERSVLFYRYILSENSMILIRYRKGDVIYVVPYAEAKASGKFEAVIETVRRTIQDASQRRSDANVLVGNRLAEENALTDMVRRAGRDGDVQGRADKNDVVRAAANARSTGGQKQKGQEEQGRKKRTLADIESELDKKYKRPVTVPEVSPWFDPEKKPLLEELMRRDPQENTAGRYEALLAEKNWDVDAAADVLEAEWVEQQVRAFTRSIYQMKWEYDLGRYTRDEISNSTAASIVKTVLEDHPDLSVKSVHSPLSALDELIGRTDLFTVLGITDIGQITDERAAGLYSFLKVRLEHDARERLAPRWEQHELSQLRQFNRWVLEHYAYPAAFKKAGVRPYEIADGILDILKIYGNNIVRASYALDVMILQRDHARAEALLRRSQHEVDLPDAPRKLYDTGRALERLGYGVSPLFKKMFPEQLGTSPDTGRSG